MIQKLTKQIVLIAVLLFPIISFGQTTLTYASGSWSPYAPSSSTGSDNVIVDDINCNMPNGAVMNDLTVNNGKSILISNRTFTVNGDCDIAVSGSIAILGTGSFTVAGTSSISVTGNSSVNKYNTWSSPFSGSVDVLGVYPGVNPCDVYVFNASTQEWKYDYAVPLSTTCNGNSVTITSAHTMVDGTADGNFDVGRGYFVPGSSTPTRVFSSSSQFNNGDVSVALYGTSLAIAGGNDWNLIGNPYPSTQRVANMLANSGTSINAIYVYIGSTGGYSTQGTGSTYKLAACQSFFVDVNSTTDGYIQDFDFSNPARRSANFTFQKTDSVQNSECIISLNSATLSDPIHIFFDPSCEDEYDRLFDARKLRNDHALNIASLIEFDPSFGPEQAVFNGLRSLNDGETKVLDLFVETNDFGSYTIEMDTLKNIPSGYSFILEDAEKGTTTNLRDYSYTFTTQQADTLDNRFSLHITYDNSVTSTESITDKQAISLFVSDNFVNIKSVSKSTSIKRVEMFDLLGRVIYSSSEVSNSTAIPVSNLNDGVYIVKVNTTSGQVISKRIYVH